MTVEIEFVRLPDQGEVSMFDLGHVQISVEEVAATSDKRVPGQAFMLFVGMSDLMDTTRVGILTGRKHVEVVMPDSSFRIQFLLKQEDLYSVRVAQRELGTVEPLTFAKALLASVEQTCRGLDVALEPDDLNDLTRSFWSLKRATFGSSGGDR